MQTTNKVLLIRPANFGYNLETASSNAFQNNTINTQETSRKALVEFEKLAQTLCEKGIEVTLAEDSKNPVKPDAIFPNNWGSFHADGRIVLYPMMAKNRRLERRPELLESLNQKFDIKEIIDLSHHEEKGVFLEGTGSIIFDHLHKKAYACGSPRTNEQLFLETAIRLGYEPIYFHAKDESGKAIYHTNVMLTIGTEFAAICLDSIHQEEEKLLVTQALKNTGKQIIRLSFEQMHAFCGNMLELQTPHASNLLALSQTAFDHLTSQQRAILEKSCELMPVDISTIEQVGGGSVRCMITELFLPLK